VRGHSQTACSASGVSLFAVFAFPLALTCWVFVRHESCSPVFNEICTTRLRRLRLDARAGRPTDEFDYLCQRAGLHPLAPGAAHRQALKAQQLLNQFLELGRVTQ